MKYLQKLFSKVVSVKMAASVGPAWDMKQAQILLWFCSCCWIKQTFPKTATLLQYSLCPCRRDLSLFWCLLPLPWAGCWSLNLSPDRPVSRGWISDKADVAKNALLFHFVLSCLCFSALLRLPNCCSSLHTRRPPASIKSNGRLIFGVFGLVPGATWPTAAAATVTVLWSITEALGPAVSFPCSITAGCTGEVKMRRTLMSMKILRRRRIPVVPNLFSLQSCGIASQGVSFHYFQS